MSSPSLFLWLNGRILAEQEVRLSPFDHGFLVGDGVFETLVARAGKPFTPRRHWQRLVNSCEQLALQPPTLAEFSEGLEAVLEANQLQEARLRYTLTSGAGPLGSERGESSAQTRMISATPLKPWPPTERVALVPWLRNEHGALTGIKATSYGENVRALAHAKAQGAGEAILLNTRQELCEGTGSNLFVIQEGRLLTPPLSSGCLAGVTRSLVLEACSAAGLSCEETALPADLLSTCEEAFLTSSTRDVHPISQIGDRALPHAPGPVTTQVQVAFRNFIQGNTDP